MDKTQISRLESGRRRLTLEWEAKILTALGLERAEVEEMAVSTMPPSERFHGPEYAPIRFVGPISNFDLIHPDKQRFVFYHRDLLTQFTTSAPGLVRLAEIESDDMEPTLRMGDRVMIDTGQTRPGNRPGLYLLRQRKAFMVRRLTVIAGAANLSVSADNQAYGIHGMVRLDGLKIAGRLIALIREL